MPEPRQSATGTPLRFGSDVDEGLDLQGDPGAVATVAAVFPAGWDRFEDVPLTEDELWELRRDEGRDLTVAQLDAVLAKLPAGALDDPEMDGGGEDPPHVAGMLGLMPRDIAAGGGFDAGGVGDRLPPGPVLAALADRTWQAGLGTLTDDELVGVALAWRRLHSWTTAAELAVVATLARRRDHQAAAAGDPGIAAHFGDELAVAMTLTGRSAAGLLDFAAALASLPRTSAALAAGTIDRSKAYVIADELSGLGRPLAARVEAQLLGAAGRQTTGQLRAAAKRAVLKTDPAAAKKRRDAARRQARVEVWHEPSGTASLAGRDLPPTEVLAADQRITALARRLKTTGHPGTLDQLRAQVYTALLLGYPVDDPAPDAPQAPQTGPGPRPAPVPPPADTQGTETSTTDDAEAARTTAAGTAAAGTGAEPSVTSIVPGSTAPGGLRGSVNLTLPLATWLGTSDAPGDLAGLGPIPAGDARTLAHALATRAGNRWCLTLTGPHGHAIAHGCTTTPANGKASRTGRSGSTGSGRGGSGSTGDGSTGGLGDGSAPTASPASSEHPTNQRHLHQTSPPGQASSPGPASTGPPGALTITLTPLATGTCDHRRETASYHPTAWLRHALHVRQRTCSAPGCRHPATGCDLDHTTPYANGGRTCECGLAPLCRRHHRAKQTHGWILQQPQPGTLIWQLPHGRTYRAEPDPYLE